MQHRFESLSIPRKTPSGAKERYRVYSDPANFRLVDAENAAGALKASELTEAWRIERYSPTLQPVLDSQIFSAVAAAAPAAAIPDAPTATAAAPAAVEAAPAAAAAQKAPEAAAPLSSEDVSKLLQEAPSAA